MYTPASSYIYSKEFLHYGSRSSAYAARRITSSLARLLAVRSVLDVGCGLGAWLRAWAENGVNDYYGVDGDYVERSILEIPSDHFTAVDLNNNFDLCRQFDLVQSLEVAEHLQPASSTVFVDALCRHAGRFILFAAAPPGQGGENHMNERPYEFWRACLARHDFVTLDAVRPMIINDQKISFWYRYNIFLYVHRKALESLAPEMHKFIVTAATPLPDLSPPSFRIRKAIVRRLPSTLQDRLARFKSRFIPTGRF